jgi:hypothetical protein
MQLGHEVQFWLEFVLFSRFQKQSNLHWQRTRRTAERAILQ